MQNYVMERLAEQKGQTENKQTKKDCWGPTDLALSLTSCVALDKSVNLFGKLS